MNADILTGVRSLLKTFPALTSAVGDRIRPNALHADDIAPAVILEIPKAEQDNCLDRDVALIRAELLVRVRSADKTQADLLAEVIRSQNTIPSTGLDSFAGEAGDCEIIQCERSEFSTDLLYDDDGDETDLYESIHVYQLWYLIGG